MTTIQNNTAPLCVDLDGTLIKTDSLIESIVKLLGQNFLKLPQIFLNVLKGKIAFKKYISQSVTLNPKALPYNQEVIEFIKSEHQKGRKVLLVTAAHESIAKLVCDQFDFIDGFLATNDQLNLLGENKANKLVQEFGEKGFDYLGNEKKDLAIWKRSRNSYVVGSASFLKWVQANVSGAQSVSVIKKKPKDFFKMFRVHQWVKNLLMFLPLILAGRLSLDLLLTTVMGFMAFSFSASSIYILNDLLDLESDRLHPKKFKRPFASGTFSIPTGIVFSVLSLSLGLGLGASISWPFFGVLLLYLLITNLYSIVFKKMMLVDVVILATLYVYRIFAGGIVTETLISEWFIAFSMFLFFCLALVKRTSEVIAVETGRQKTVSGRSYKVVDKLALSALGASSGFLAVLVLALYINSDQVKLLYQSPQYLWALCPFMMYWLSRVWILTLRDEMHHDPIVFAVKDKVTYLIGVFFVVIFLLAQGVFL